jgi:hypothetical protein
LEGDRHHTNGRICLSAAIELGSRSNCEEYASVTQRRLKEPPLRIHTKRSKPPYPLGPSSNRLIRYIPENSPEYVLYGSQISEETVTFFAQSKISQFSN